MLSTISWPAFLVFLLSAALLYYIALLVVGIAQVMRRRTAEQKKESKDLLAAVSGHHKANARSTESNPQAEMDMLLEQELRRWLYWAKRQPFDRNGILLGIETHLKLHPAERHAMTPEEVHKMLERVLLKTGSISLTPAEIRQLWDASEPIPTFSFRQTD